MARIEARNIEILFNEDAGEKATFYLRDGSIICGDVRVDEVGLSHIETKTLCYQDTGEHLSEADCIAFLIALRVYQYKKFFKKPPKDEECTLW